MFPCEAAGIGQLVRAYNIAVAADSTLQIVHVTRWPHEMLELVGLLTLLGGIRSLNSGISKAGSKRLTHE
jgi:hypothetical protein